MYLGGHSLKAASTLNSHHVILGFAHSSLQNLHGQRFHKLLGQPVTMLS